MGSIERKLESRPDLWCISSPSSWWTPFLFLTASSSLPLFDQWFIRRAGLQLGSAHGAMTPISNPFRPKKDKTLVQSSEGESGPILMRTTSTAAAGLNESFQEVNKVRIMAHGGIAQLLLALGPSVWRACEVSQLVPWTVWAVLRCSTAVSDGWRQLFVFLSSLRPTDKAQAEGWVTSSVKMCGIILLLLLSWQREDTWQMLFCSLMQAFGFFPFLLSNCFGICRMGWRDVKKTCASVCAFTFPMKGQTSTWIHEFDCCTIGTLP